jgi:uracil-DNA glycosylase
MELALPGPWQDLLADLTGLPWFAELDEKLYQERRHYKVFPAPDEVFAAFELTPPSAVKVVLLGSDPYPGDGHAHGLAFSSRTGLQGGTTAATRYPVPLGYMLEELQTDLRCPPPQRGDLTAWGRQGVLLLNSTLTVRAHRSGSHRGLGWEAFTDGVLARLASRSQPVVFVLWGQQAQRKTPLVQRAPHAVLGAAFPSTLSAARFLGSRPYTRINAALRERGLAEIDWKLP